MPGFQIKHKFESLPKREGFLVFSNRKKSERTRIFPRRFCCLRTAASLRGWSAPGHSPGRLRPEWASRQPIRTKYPSARSVCSKGACLLKKMRRICRLIRTRSCRRVRRKRGCRLGWFRGDRLYQSCARVRRHPRRQRISMANRGKKTGLPSARSCNEKNLVCIWMDDRFGFFVQFGGSLPAPSAS